MVLAVGIGLAMENWQSVEARAQAQDSPDSGWMIALDRLVEKGISEGKMHGCVIGFGSRQGLLWSKAYGHRRVEPGREPMTVDTIFDLASLTKPIATATSVMRLIETGLVRLDAPVSEYLPDFGQAGKTGITVRHLLIHTSGLIADNALSDYANGPEIAWNKICELRSLTPPGTEFRYSDVNFIVLGKLIENRAGMSLDDYVRVTMIEPLGMQDTCYGVPLEKRNRCAPTEKRDGEWISGTVHDPRAWALSGVAGHAGLFSTVEDLGKYAQAMLGAKDSHWLHPETIHRMIAPNRVSGGVRGLGWDIQTGFSSNRGDLLGPRAYGHGGFTGTVLWIDPDRDFFFIFLSSRLHPDGKGSVNGLAGNVANLLISADRRSRSEIVSRRPVRLGIDVLQDRGFEPLKGKRVGLITNQTGLDSRGVPTVRILNAAADVTLHALFSPEHGFFGNLDENRIANGVEMETGLAIYSLYGDVRKPTADMLSDIDVLVFDIQDIGTRFYTYISTLGETLSSAAEHGKEFIVLDRPNPINGIDVAGPMLDPNAESFVSYHPLPIRHGMTVGELAMMFRDERQLKVDLTIVPCENWDRASYWDTTGLAWVNPSPNMRSLRQAFLYPGIGFLELTNISVGRGTDTPFEIIGAPWIDAVRVANELNQMRLVGVTFVPRSFTPDASKFAGERCQGIEVLVTDRKHCEPVGVGIAIALTLQRVHGDIWDTRSLHRLLGSQAVADAIRDGSLAPAGDSRLTEGLDAYARRKSLYHLYP
jgi:uncharacterized protein YbbC (DUF1343 family)/CubicO group peptidase (beta-lactamase class C family)